jgi:hypothetical protein
MKNLQAKIQTKSNYRNLNGEFVRIVQFLGKNVYCEYINEDGDSIFCHFNLDEITEIQEII